MINGIVVSGHGGFRDVQARIARLGLNTQDLRRPNANVAKYLVVSNKMRLDRGVDVHGRPLKSKLSKRLGVQPLGGAHRTPGKSIRSEIEGQDVNLFSTWIGAGVAYRGDVIRPKLKKYLTIPLRARGGEYSSSDRGVSVVGNRTGRRALHYKNTFFIRRNGKLLLMQKQPDGALRALFLLVKSTKYPKNEWLGASSEDLDYAVKVYSKHLDTFEGNGSGGGA